MDGKYYFLNNSIVPEQAYIRFIESGESINEELFAYDPGFVPIGCEIINTSTGVLNLQGSGQKIFLDPSARFKILNREISINGDGPFSIVYYP